MGSCSPRIVSPTVANRNDTGTRTTDKTTAIGIAFGLGVVSLPVQLYASRIPIERARRNVQIFLAIAALQAWLLAFLVGTGATGGFAVVALGVTITAEIAVSVLYATAWQPLLASGVDTHGRQQLNSTWPAIARGVLAGGLVLFATATTVPAILWFKKTWAQSEALINPHPS